MKLKNICINYGLLDKAKNFYCDLGYEYIETPWVVDAMSSISTYQHSSGIFILNDGKHMVGSGEQGFIQLARDGKLTPWKKYMTITPCFRRGEDDRIHAEHFMKLELFLATSQRFCETEDIKFDIQTLVYDLERPHITSRMIEDAKRCFHLLGLSWDSMQVDTLEIHDSLLNYMEHNLYTIQNHDISFVEENKPLLELGSYGFRREKLLDVIGTSTSHRYYYYGTGLALPRFQLALNA